MVNASKNLCADKAFAALFTDQLKKYKYINGFGVRGSFNKIVQYIIHLYNQTTESSSSLNEINSTSLSISTFDELVTGIVSLK